MTTKELLSESKNTVAKRHGYADWFQIDMTDNEQYVKEEIKASMLDEVALECMFWESIETPYKNWPDEKVLGTNGSGYAVGMLQCNMNGRVFIEDDDRILFITHYQLLTKI